MVKEILNSLFKMNRARFRCIKLQQRLINIKHLVFGKELRLL